MNVVVGNDGRPHSERAAEYALAYAKAFQANLFMIYIVSPNKIQEEKEKYIKNGMRVLGRAKIRASDIDEEVLESARRGVYVPRQVVNVNPTYLARHFTLVDGKYQVSPEIMDMVRFRNIDLFTSTAGSHFDMILCRNVVIYFTREMQERLYMKFHSSLRPGGYLVMGNTETLVGEAVHLFRPVRPRERIYQKADASYP